MLPSTFRFIWPSFFREDLKISANQKQVFPVADMPDPLTNMATTWRLLFLIG
jgi:hypothetical protein